ncbi:MAG: zinc ABC transporter substrate-binding protein [Defluviitaleaceae bacterium]|nr:zinc ABC transporter substrate-binding protein [Defluviitaleaceae bacterium]
MLKKFFSTAFFVIFAIFITSCTTENGASSQNLASVPASETETPVIYTSFHAIHNFTQLVVQDILPVRVLITPGVEAHLWEPTAQDMVNIHYAAVFIYHGFGMEHFVDSIRASVGGSVPFIEASANVTPALQDADPHLWLNPLYALTITETIKNALVQLFPEHSAAFEQNFEVAAENFLALDLAYQAAAADFVRRDIVVSHGAFAHLAYAYNLNQVAIEGLDDHADPSPARMAEIIDFVQANNVTTIFYDEDDTLATAVANATGASVAMLNTFEGLTAGDYFTVMYQNLQALVLALS